MISDMFRRDYTMMKSRGIELSLDDVVRLNALAVKVKLSREAAGVVHLQRAAWLGDVVLREPTIGHEMWLERVGDYIDLSRGDNFNLVHGYALSRDHADLPNPLFRTRTIRRVFSFARKTLSRFTSSQLSDALVYVLWGADWKIGEMPPARNCDDGADGSPAVGVVIDARARRIGLTVDDAKRMTASELLETISRSEVVDKVRNMDWEYNRAMGDYVRARNEITCRLSPTRKE